MNYLAFLVGSYLAFANVAQHNIHSTGGSDTRGAALVDLDALVPANEWQAYKKEHAKVYESDDIETMRKIIYANNKHRVYQFMGRQKSVQSTQVTEVSPWLLSSADTDANTVANSMGQPDESYFSVALNHLADLSDVELKAINGFRLPKAEPNQAQANDTEQSPAHLRNSPAAQLFIDSISSAGLGPEFANIELGDDGLPLEVDWRTIDGRVSPVKNQGQCGSCWAFASTGALEGQERGRPKALLRRTRHGRKLAQTQPLVELSEQNLVDCSTENYGCGGGFMKAALDFVKQEGGIDDEQSYPYEALTKKCRFKPEKVAFTDAGGALLPTGDEQKLKETVAKFGPVAVAIDASSFWFQLYHKGVYRDRFCKKKLEQLDHGVLVVGYGTDPKKGDYWLVKNSWGGHWGEKGYIRMARNHNNMCGIATAATIPTF